MKILALNTAFANSDVGFCDGEKKDYISHSSSARHSENILVCVDELLKKNNEKIQNIDVISVVVGPGSFTGIRIGVGIVKGMYIANNKLKLISICSLDLMAYTYAKQNVNQDFWCVLDALSGNIFVCKYNKLGERLSQPQMLTGEMQDSLNGIVVGLICERMNICNQFISFSAQELLDYTIQKCQNNEFVSEKNLLPIYLRKSQAEIGLENANKKNW